MLANKLGNEKLYRIVLLAILDGIVKTRALQAIYHSVNEDHNKRERYVILLKVLYVGIRI